MVGDRWIGVRPVAPAAEVREDEVRARVACGEPREVGAVRDLLRRPLAATMLPDVMQDGQPALACELRDRVEERIVRATARQKLDAHGPLPHTPFDLRERVVRVVRVHRHEHAHAVRFGTRDREHLVVAARHVLRRREVGRRGEAVAAERRRDVPGDADAITGTQPRGVEVGPVVAAGVRVVEVRVRVDQRFRAGEGRGETRAWWRRHRSSSRSSTNAWLATASISRSASSSCATDA